MYCTASWNFLLLLFVIFSPCCFGRRREQRKRALAISYDYSIFASYGRVSLASDRFWHQHFCAGSSGDVVYVELPEVGQKLQQGDTAGAIESVKAASDVYSPVSGVVTEKNSEVETKPHLINKSTYDKGWLYKLELTNEKELQHLMDETAYEKYRTQEQSSADE
uniref:Glycine cleavage system H protein, mitochondrial n=1 Tax=Ditylenchus dipsaci TaxID=166011 RepID=A0A915DF94_9BILA